MKLISSSIVFLIFAILTSVVAQPLKVFILAGQSNMQGHAEMGTFDYIGDDPATAPMLKEMRDADGKPRVCDKVWISSIGCLGDAYTDLTEKKGKLTAGFGAPDDKIGPEFTFGIYLEKHDQVEQMAYLLNSKNEGQANADGKMTEAQQNEYLKGFEAKLITRAETALWKRGASNAGYHYLGCAKTFALMGKAFAEATLQMKKAAGMP